MIDFRKFCIDSAKLHYQKFCARYAKLQPRGSPMLLSELLCIVSVGHAMGVRHYVESGRDGGISTQVIAEYTGSWVDSVDVHTGSHDHELVAQYENLRLHRGDGNAVVPRIIDETPEFTTTALVLDGPKNLGGWNLYQRVKDRVAVAFIHDVSRNSPVRDMLPEGSFLTDDDEYVERFGAIDASWLEHGGFSSHAELFRTSSVVAVVRAIDED